MSNDMWEAFLVNQVYGGGLGGALGSQLWMNVAFLVSLFLVIIVRPASIRNLSLFRMACYFFAFSLLLPIVINLFVGILIPTMTGAAQRPGVPPGSFNQIVNPAGSGSFLLQLLLRILTSFGPILFGVSVLMALLALIPSFVPPPSLEPIGDGSSIEPRPVRGFRAPQSSARSGPDEPVFDG